MQHYESLEEEPGRGIEFEGIKENSHLSGPASFEFENVTVHYGDQERPALSNVSFKIEQGMKVGIVGRTGAGKSSLLKALFRFVECEKGSDILINGSSIYAMGVTHLRSIITFLPQTAFLYEGTIAENLDPLGAKSRRDLWECVEALQMRDYIEGLPDGLDQVIGGSESSLSEGQKQLLCLARAMLRESTQILVMDESTANVDVKTESLIRETIQRRFKRCTVLIVSHRAENVAWCDKVMELENGEIKGFGAPSLILD